MKLYYIYIFLFAIMFIGCDDTIDADQGPCKFPPSESNFPVFSSVACEECYFNLQFEGKEYSFAGNQFEVGSGAPTNSSDTRIVYYQMHNAFLSFYLVSPPSDDELNNSINVKTPLLKETTLSNLSDHPPSVSASFGIKNYCQTFFEPITGSVSQSYNKLTAVELIDSYFVGNSEGSTEQYQLHIYYCYGELSGTFIIDGENQVITSNYKVRSFIYEKL